MDDSNKKILTISFIFVAAVTGFVISVILTSLAATFGVVARLMDSVALRHGIPWAVSFAVFASLQFNPKIMTWGDLVVSEVKKVVWPAKNDTMAMTIVVCFVLLLSGVILGSFDFFSSYLVNMMVK